MCELVAFDETLFVHRLHLDPIRRIAVNHRFFSSFKHLKKRSALNRVDFLPAQNGAFSQFQAADGSAVFSFPEASRVVLSLRLPASVLDDTKIIRVAIALLLELTAVRRDSTVIVRLVAVHINVRVVKITIPQTFRTAFRIEVDVVPDLLPVAVRLNRHKYH